MQNTRQQGEGRGWEWGQSIGVRRGLLLLLSPQGGAGFSGGQACSNADPYPVSMLCLSVSLRTKNYNTNKRRMSSRVPVPENVPSSLRSGRQSIVPSLAESPVRAH